MADSNLRVPIPAADIQARVQEMGRQITESYRPDSDLLVLCILKGGVLFHADLVRAIELPLRMDFIGISSYGKGKLSSGEVRLTKDLDMSVEGADILIVEDIVDSGITLSYLVQLLEARRPRSIRVVTLLDKPERRMRPVEVSWVGFRIPDEFVVGYGLDYAEKYRNLPDICVLTE